MWDYLFEAVGDEYLRRLERKAKESGALSDWVAYRKAGIARGRDPVLAPMRELLRGRRDDILRQLGLPEKLPLDLEGEYTITHDGENYRFRIRPSPRTGGGVGSRMSTQCPMCGAWVAGSSLSSFGMGRHLNRKDHGGTPRKQTLRQMWTSSIKKQLPKVAGSFLISKYYLESFRALVVYTTQRDEFVEWMDKRYPALTLVSERMATPEDVESESRYRPYNVRLSDHRLSFKMGTT